MMTAFTEAVALACFPSYLLFLFLITFINPTLLFRTKQILSKYAGE